MDFDDEEEDMKSLTSFENRKRMLRKIIHADYEDRVFLLGVNHKESEALKPFFRTSNFENIGKELIKNCPNGDLSNWKNTHLECNLAEIDRMKKNGIFDWLFYK